MTDQETLAKAIDIAIKNGWQAEMFGGNDFWRALSITDKDYALSELLKSMFSESSVKGYLCLIFDHDFARALWGDNCQYMHDGYRKFNKGEQLSPSQYRAIEDKDFWRGAVSYEPWQFHLQQLAIAENPIQYLKENMPE